MPSSADGPLENFFRGLTVIGLLADLRYCTHKTLSMRRAVVLAFRITRRHPVQSLVGRSLSSRLAGSNVLARRPSLLARRSAPLIAGPLQASMNLRSLTVAFVSSAVASGAWYYTTSSKPIETEAPAPSSSSPVGRRALMVENDQFYTGQLAGDEPVSKYSAEFGRRVLEMMTPDQASEKLRRNQESYLVNRGNGVIRYDVVQLPSNDPIEDDHAEKIVDVSPEVAPSADGTGSDWMFWSVFDGHSGWTTSAKLRQTLISYVARELNSTYKSATADPALSFPAPEAVDHAIKKGFLRLDHDIVHESVDRVLKSNSKRVGAELLAPALSGSCALLAFYDTRSDLLRVACTGDSRAVLGRKGPSGKWTATALSEDQTGGTPSEAARLQREHPGEPGVVRNGRVLGSLEPTRAFGDAFYKWTRQTQEKVKRHFFGRTPHPGLHTPPYVTAEPVVTTTSIAPDRGDFLVLATDGLWEMLSNEEVVGLVGQWIEQQKAVTGTSAPKSWLQSWFAQSPKLPVEGADGSSGSSLHPSGQRVPVRQIQYDIPAANSRFVVEDKNAATHLVRNALGGHDKDMVCALLTLPSPYSRRYRDDLTVEVIFFGNGGASGDVSVNSEASAPVDAKPKL